MPKLTIDLTICKKSGQCYYMQPDLVRRGPENLPNIIAAEVPADMADAAEELLDVCPTGAIDLVD